MWIFAHDLQSRIWVKFWCNRARRVTSKRDGLYPAIPLTWIPRTSGSFGLIFDHGASLLDVAAKTFGRFASGEAKDDHKGECGFQHENSPGFCFISNAEGGGLVPVLC